MADTAQYESIMNLKKKAEMLLVEHRTKKESTEKELGVLLKNVQTEFGVSDIKGLQTLFNNKKDEFNTVVGNMNATIVNLRNVLTTNQELASEKLMSFLSELEQTVSIIKKDIKN